MTIWVIANPTAGSGRARKAASDVVSRLAGGELKDTSGPGDATRWARKAREEGVETVIAVGGDGTVQECVTGLCLDASGAHVRGRTKLAVLPAGTGGDFRKTFGWTNSVSQLEARLAEPEERLIDVGRVTYERTSQVRVTAFANVLSFGLGGLTVRVVESGPKWVGGRMAFFAGALRATAIHQPIPIELRLDGEVIETAPFSNVAVCLGQYFGGGMRIAPDADPSDGLFDVVTMEMSKVQTVTLAGSIYRGAHFKKAGVHHYRCRKLEARPTRQGESLFEVDGEQPGILPIQVEMLPAALTLLV